jgi:hypothetical protein
MTGPPSEESRHKISQKSEDLKIHKLEMEGGGREEEGYKNLE